MGAAWRTYALDGGRLGVELGSGHLVSAARDGNGEEPR